jgi:hypothetical protein
MVGICNLPSCLFSTLVFSVISHNFVNSYSDLSQFPESYFLLYLIIIFFLMSESVLEMLSLLNYTYQLCRYLLT